MKNLSALVVLIFCSLFLFAQTGEQFYFLQTDTTATFYHENDVVTDVYLYMQNDEVASTDVSWIVDWGLEDDWNLSLCAGEGCFTLDTSDGNTTGSSANNVEVPGNGEMYWKLQLTHNQVPGTGNATVTVKSTTNVFYESVINVNMEVTDVVGIKDQYAMNVAFVYPNPVVDVLKMNTSQNVDLAKMILTNSLGQTVSIKNIDKQLNVQNMDVKILPQGIYNLTVTKENGKIFSSQMIEIK